MTMKFKNTLYLLNALFILTCASSALADECGVLRYLATKSNGVAVTDNRCKNDGDMALGSGFNLMPGARLWFKSMDTDATTQGICQNRSAKPVHIRIDSAAEPWIKADGLANCSTWVNNKMSCPEATGQQVALSCVLASVDPKLRNTGFEERTTSVRMRTLPMLNEADSTTQPAKTEKEAIISAMQSDVDLCRSVNSPSSPVKMTWLVATNGKADKVSADGAGRDKPFIDCLTVIIKDFPYPQSSTALWLSHYF